MAKFVFAGGGSAGHALPSIRVALEMRARGADIFYIGSENSIEMTLCKRHDIEFFAVKTAKFDRSRKLSAVGTIGANITGILSVRSILRQLDVDGVFASGGFASVPVVIGAKTSGIKKILIHACDLTLGLANNICLPFASELSCTFEQTKAISRKAFFSGPIVDRKLLMNRPNLVQGKPVLLVYGGSQGSQAINSKIRRDIHIILKKFDIIHLCGRGNLDASLENTPGYEQYEYVFDFPEILMRSHLAISRAGSNSLWELILTRTPHLAVPIPKSVSRGDQHENCKYFASKGVTTWLEQEEFLKSNLPERLIEILLSSDTIVDHMVAMTPDKPAVSRIAEILLQ
ncbi:UDP-N-acetylglucosamine--N-acetylmuramyl-(pentapeptide) pyrophosphoryl-undecaprenol N-acetylglucosamine transferase [Rhizobium sp. PAMB 3174]